MLWENTRQKVKKGLFSLIIKKNKAQKGLTYD